MNLKVLLNRHRKKKKFFCDSKKLLEKWSLRVLERGKGGVCWKKRSNEILKGASIQK